MVEYARTSDITKATHWLATEDDSEIASEYLHITVGKFYPMIFEFDEYYVEDDVGEIGMYYMVHNGDFVIVDK